MSYIYIYSIHSLYATAEVNNRFLVIIMIVCLNQNDFGRWNFRGTIPINAIQK